MKSAYSLQKKMIGNNSAGISSNLQSSDFFRIKKTIFLLGIIFLIPGNLIFSQQKDANISYSFTSHDFGKINEADGPASFKFEFTNTGSVPLILSDVQASCGCTTPSWSKEPVMPGAKGYITATYNPKGRPGRFDKTITVKSNANDDPVNYLKISGEVVPKEKTIDDVYKVVYDSLRFSEANVTFKLTVDKTDSKKIEVFNPSNIDINLTFPDLPKHLTVVANPQTLKPKQKGTILITYNASIKKDFGFVTDVVNIAENKKIVKTPIFSANADISEDFSKMTDEEKKNAPVISFDSTTYDFGQIKQGASVSFAFKFKNNGKSDLLIRKVSASCGCTAVSPKSTVIRQGDSSVINATFNSKGKSGTQNKTITVITNDPVTPKKILWIKGTVLEPQ